MLHELFRDIQKNKNQFLNSSTGEEFENRIKMSLRRARFDEVYQDQFPAEDFSKLKNIVLDKKTDKIIDNFLINKGFKNCYIYQPYGSQQFPDFLVFTENSVIPIEIKFSRKSQTKPMWNSNLPKSNSIYIFGSFGKNDITFFLGSDILPQVERVKMIEFFDEVKELELKFKEEIKNLVDNGEIALDHGFTVYARRAYEQNKKINPNAELDYFTLSNRGVIEQNVLDFCQNV